MIRRRPRSTLCPYTPLFRSLNRVLRLGAQFGTHTSLPARMSGVTRDPSTGNLWVWGLGIHRGLILDPTGETLSSFYVGNQLGSPQGVAFDARNGRLDVVNKN